MSPPSARDGIRVAHVLNTLGHGGVPKVAGELLRRLPERYDRRLYCLSPGTDHDDIRTAQAEWFHRLGVRTRVADTLDRAAAVADMSRWFAEDRIEIVHTHSYKPNRYVRAAALGCGLRTVAHYHNQYDDKWAAPGAFSLEQELARATDQLIACSESVREHLVERLGIPRSRIALVPDGVNAGDYRGGDGSRLRRELGIPAGSPIVGTVGRLSRQKAHGDFLLAARRVADAYPSTTFLVVGAADDPVLERELHDLCARLALTDRVRFTGYHEALADVYAALDVFVLSSHWEGFGLVLVEAMAAGTPVVATAVGPVPEVVGATRAAEGAAVLVPPSAPGELARAVVGLLAEPARRRELARRGLARAGLFSWETAAQRLDTLYTALLEPARRGSTA